MSTKNSKRVDQGKGDLANQTRRARDPDPSVRAALAADPDTAPEILFFLAEDRNPEVRRQVALNANTPQKADLLLTGDSECAVRLELAGKVARLTPSLSSAHQEILTSLTVKALEVLAEDQMVEVREILSDALKSVADAPNSVIQKLARDTAITVAGPVLEFSPVLSDQDLLAIIESGPIQGALNAIAKRDSLRETVSDAIARSGDEEAVAVLLSNETAQIREDTLDFIVDRAADRVSWHEPLALRPNLPPKTLQRISTFVAMNLLDKIQRRMDMDDSTLVQVASTVEKQIAKNAERRQSERQIGVPDDLASHVNQLHEQGNLNVWALQDALARGDRGFVMLALSKLSGIKTDVVESIISTADSKAAISLVWKSGLSPSFAQTLRVQLLGHVPVAQPNTNYEGWPMSPDKMQWHLEFHTSVSA